MKTKYKQGTILYFKVYLASIKGTFISQTDKDITINMTNYNSAIMNEIITINNKFLIH